jgi:transposase
MGSDSPTPINLVDCGLEESVSALLAGQPVAILSGGEPFVLRNDDSRRILSYYAPRCLSAGEAAVSRGDLTRNGTFSTPCSPTAASAAQPLQTNGGRSTVLGFAQRRALARHAQALGNWNSVFVRFPRWSKLGVWDAVSETLASLGPADEEHAIDSTIVRAHQHAAGVKGGIKSMKRSAARAAVSRPKSTSAPTANPLTFDVTPGEVHETRGFDALMELDRRPAKLLGDKGYDSDEIRADLAKRGIEPVIPPRSNRKATIDYDRERRNLIERCVNRLKQFRRAAA